MAEVILQDMATGMLKKVISLAAAEVSLAWGFKGELKRLEKELKMILALVSAAESGPLRMEPVKLWLKQLKAVAYSADDVLDEFSYELLRRKVEVGNRKRNKVRNFFTSSNNPLAFRLKMAHKIKNINSLLAETHKKAIEIGLRPVEHLVTNASVEIKEIRQTHPFVDDSEVVGRDDDVVEIVNMLLLNHSNNEKDLSVIGIVGMGGQGKTTLAQLVYNKDEVVKHFDQRIWVTVSDDFDVTRLLNEMVQSLTQTSSQLTNMEAVIKILQEKLQGKKFLLVLDDVWNENPERWDCMRDCLKGIGGSRGSRVMVTTRSEAVVSTMETSLTYPLKRLSDEDSWALFKRRAFAFGGATETPNLVAIGKMMVKRCGGVPLAIRVLGGLMHSKKEECEWLSIQNSPIWDSLEIRNSGVLPTLKLSYDHLPSSSAKHCFSYCSIFPKDSNLGKDSLIQLWMAQGLLHPLEMEDVGDDYFNLLLFNSLLHDPQKGRYDNIETCKMHDLVHDLALRTSESHCLSLTSEASEVKNVSEVVHLSSTSRVEILPEILKVRFVKLRTLYLMGDFNGKMLTDFKCLRVLVLVNRGVKELPSSIGELKHLRYLDISKTNIRTLPNSIAKLYNLQTLKLSDMKELPQKFTHLVNLRNFYMDDNEDNRKCMLIGVGQLTNLRTLPFFVVSPNKGCQIEELGGLSNIKGVLKIYGLENVRSTEEAKKANLSGKPNIDSLEFHWTSRQEEEHTDGAILEEECNDGDILEGLLPRSNLKGLVIKNFMGKSFASWMMVASHSLLLPNLVHVTLVNCNRCERIPTLGHLPCLKFVVLSGMQRLKQIGSEFYGHNHDGASNSTTGSGVGAEVFPALRNLHLMNMPKLVEWLDVTGTVFPSLEVLEIVDCPMLFTAPSHFPSIKKLRGSKIESLLLANMSSKLISLTSLCLVEVSGTQVISVMEELLEKNRFLRYLDIDRCDELSYFPNCLQNLVALETLDVWNCPKLTSFPDVTTNCLSSLCSFYIGQCEELTCLPDGLQTLVSLETFYICDCPNLMAISDIYGLQSLRRLTILGCAKLTGLPSGLESCKSLDSLTIRNCPALDSIPDLRQLPRSLRLLRLAYCGKSMTCWPEGLHCLTGLRDLGIGGFSEELDHFPWPSNSSAAVAAAEDDFFGSLESLTLYGRPKLTSLPEQLQHLSVLNSLAINKFDGLVALPDWLGDILSLQTLHLFNCSKLMNLPTARAMRRLTNLQNLYVDICPLLGERCTKEIGPEWLKIAHIPFIQIDGKKIQDLN